MDSRARATALVLEAPRRLVEREFELPRLGDDDGLLRVEACGLCGTDHEQYTGHLPAGFAFIPGHEAVGVIEAVGGRAAARWGVQVGDRVAVEVFQSCRACDECRAGRYRRCVRHGMGDMCGFIDVAKPPGLWGGYATHQYLGPDAMLLPLPKDLDPVVATLFNPLGAGIRWTTTVGGAGQGDVVAVLGPGIRGLSACVAAKEAGAAFVAITGVGPRDTGRLALAAQFGADLAIDVAVEDPAKALRRATGGRLADVVVDVTAKAPTALAQGVALARPGGTVVLAGTRGSPDTPGFWPDHVVYKELHLVGALGVDVAAYRAAIDVLTARRWPFEDVPRQCSGFEAAGELLKTMAGEIEGEAPVHAVLVP
ncbi:MAG: alcohol dehydrogenase [Acidimicrobiaceae bacterium]